MQQPEELLAIWWWWWCVEKLRPPGPREAWRGEEDTCTVHPNLDPTEWNGVGKRESTMSIPNGVATRGKAAPVKSIPSWTLKLAQGRGETVQDQILDSKMTGMEKRKHQLKVRLRPCERGTREPRVLMAQTIRNNPYVLGIKELYDRMCFIIIIFCRSEVLFSGKKAGGLSRIFSENGKNK